MCNAVVKLKVIVYLIGSLQQKMFRYTDRLTKYTNSLQSSRNSRQNHSILFIVRKETGLYDFRSINFIWSLGPYAFKSVTTKFSGEVLVSPTGAETKAMCLLQFFKNIVIWMKILDFSKYLMNELRHKVQFVHVIIELKVISVGCDQADLRLSTRLFSLISIES